MALLARRAALVAFLMLASGCATDAVIGDRLFFGTDIPGGGTVSDSDWATFMKDVVTPRFKDGLTVLDGNGQWLGADGQIARERVHVVEVEHKRDEASEAAIREIATEYKRRFKQEAVLRVTAPVTMKFY